MSMSSTSTITNISTSHRISNGAQACAACKYQRRKCAPDCILAPYFPHDRHKQFLNAHKLFGVSNITKIIRNLKQHEKDIAMRTIMFQSDMRAKDPVGGCYKIATALQHQIAYVENELQFVLQQIAMCRAHQAAYQQQQQMQIPVNNDDPTTSSYEILQEFNDNQISVNAHQQQQQQQDINQPQLHENGDDVGGGEVLNHQPQQDHVVQDFQYSWSLQDSVWIPSKGSSNKEGSPVLGHEYVEITSLERGDSFKFDQQANEKSEMILKAENLTLEDEEEAFQQHQIPEHDLRTAATLFTLTS